MSILRAKVGHVMPFLLETQEFLCQAAQTVEPSQATRSGCHTLMSQTYVIERWFWDAELRIWRQKPETIEAETPFDLGCLGYVYLAEEQGDPPFQSGSTR
jgi:hypothetical protein